MAADAPQDPEERRARARSAWVEDIAAQLREALVDPEVLALLDASDPERDQQRREQAARKELSGMRITVPLLNEDEEALDAD